MSRARRGLLLAIVLAAGCRATHPAPAGPPAPVTLTGDDAGRSIELALGQELWVRLASNHSTGYAWSLAEVSDAVVAQQQPARYEESDATRVGAGGTEIFHLEAVRAGEQTLRFEYRRPWERNALPARAVSYAISVR